MEEWRPVVGYEGLYEVSSLGRVRSLERQQFVGACGWRGSYVRTWPSRIMKTKLCRGYEQLTLSKDGSEKSLYVHGLVAAAFIGSRPEGFQVAHGDGSRLNNSLSNLRYASVIDNVGDRRLHGTMLPGMRNPSHALSDADVLFIRASNESGPQLAARFGVQHPTIYRIKNRKGWKHI
jgi:hypothetical protein